MLHYKSVSINITETLATLKLNITLKLNDNNISKATLNLKDILIYAFLTF